MYYRNGSFGPHGFCCDCRAQLVLKKEDRKSFWRKYVKKKWSAFKNNNIYIVPGKTKIFLKAVEKGRMPQRTKAVQYISAFNMRSHKQKHTCRKRP